VEIGDCNERRSETLCTQKDGEGRVGFVRRIRDTGVRPFQGEYPATISIRKKKKTGRARVLPANRGDGVNLRSEGKRRLNVQRMAEADCNPDGKEGIESIF